MNLEYLRHGKALCGKVFRRFVETFNFHNDFISNIKGDADLQVVGGKVKVDRTDERHPVIRCKGCGGGGGGGDAEKTVLPFDGKATKNSSGEWVVSMEPGQVIGAADTGVRTVNLTGSASTGDTVTLYVIESSSGSQRFVAAAQTPAVSTGERITMRITLFRVANDGVVTQYTRGRIDLNGALIVGEAGPIGGGEKSALSGKVEAKGESGSGLIVRSYVDTLSLDNKGTMAVDIKDRQTSDLFAIREVKNSKNETIAKFLGTAGFTLDDMPDLDVLKDISFDYDVGQHMLTATKTTVNLKTKKETVGEAEEIFTAAPHFQNENPVAMTGAQFEP